MKQFKSSLSSLFYLSLFLFIITSSACGSISPVVATPKKKPTPTATAILIPTATTLSNLTTYTGPNFSISHPNGWPVKKEPNDDAWLIQGPFATIVILTTNPTTGNEGTTIIDDGISNQLNGIGTALKHSTQTTLTPVTIDGMVWKRAAISGDETTHGNTYNVDFVVLGVEHPKDGIFYLILENYTDNFDDINIQYFQPMLASFKFK